MRKAGVIGWPIGHSRSPLIHGYWLRQYQIDGAYDRFAVEPSAVADFVAGFERKGLSGFNITLPHKEAVFELVTPADENTSRLCAVNTVFLRSGKILGTNTDGEGFISNIQWRIPDFDIRNSRVVVLGAGGAAMAVIASLLDAGAAEVGVANRRAERVETVLRRFDGRIRAVTWEERHDTLSECAMLINTTALGMTGEPPLELSLEQLPDDAIVTDIVYSPLRTPLLQEAAMRGNPIVDGLGMLLYQAVRGFEIWFGRRPVVTQELYDLVAVDLDSNYRP